MIVHEDGDSQCRMGQEVSEHEPRLREQEESPALFCSSESPR